jgi:putative transposase
MDETLEGCRYVYNETLELRKNAWEKDQKSISLSEIRMNLVILKENKEDLYNIYSQILQDAQGRVDFAFKSFFRRCKLGEKPGYPRFKNKSSYNSFTYTQKGFKIINNKLNLTFIGDLKIKLHRCTEGKIKTLTIKKTSTNKWFATFSCEFENVEQKSIINTVGIDLGLTTFATMSDGNTIQRQRFFKQYEKKLANASRKREALAKGSKERNKKRIIESKIYEKSTNKRKDFCHKEALNLVKKYDLIVFENLSIDKIQQTNMKAVKKGIADVAWNQFVQFVSYKAENAGKKVILVDPRNTSKICSGCGLIVDKILSTRNHECSCGLILNRDLNAAINIHRRGLSSLAKA